MGEGLGTVTLWGFSPAVDFQNTDVGIVNACDKDVLNVLQVGAGDIRHILKSIAFRKRHGNKKLHFYVCESSLSVYARDILLTSIVLESKNRMGLEEKSECFLELFGNILIREQTHAYVEKMANELIKMVTDFDLMDEKLPIFDLSQLKFRERDYLEGIFKMWRKSDFNIDAPKCWDLRMRHYLKNRYDTRMNAFDWDYSMTLHERGGDMIHRREYQDWRNTGVAFELREGTYNACNKTLASSRLFNNNGDRHSRIGYWGDIVNSPFIAFGIESENQSLFKKSNNLYGKTAGEISQYNVQAWLHELMTGEKYKPPEEEETKKTSSGATLTDVTEEDEESESVDKSTQQVPPQVSLHDLPYKSIPLNGDVKITFLPMGSVKDLVKKSKYQNLFDIAYFSNSMVHNLTPDLNKIFADGCTVLLETAQFMVDVKTELLDEFVVKTTSMASAAGCQRVTKTESTSFTRHEYIAA